MVYVPCGYFLRSTVTHMAKRLAFMGAGAIGGTIGGYLTRAGHDVTVIDAWPAHIDKIRADGLTVTTMEGVFTARPEALHVGELSATVNRYDIVFVSVKSYDTAWVTTLVGPHLAPGGVVVSAQNGINEDTIAGIVGWDRVIGCVVTIGATTVGPGHVERTSRERGRRSFALGDPTNTHSPRLQELRTILEDCGDVVVTDNLLGERWAKIATNSMANSVCGITGQTSAGMRMNPVTREIALRLAAEVVEVGTAHGVAIEKIGSIPAHKFVEARADAVVKAEVERIIVEEAPKIGTGRPSLAQDLAKHRRTEIDYLNGYVIRKGREAGVPTPFNDAVVDLTKQVEEGVLEPMVDNIWLVMDYPPE